jgi:hypothetical protein
MKSQQESVSLSFTCFVFRKESIAINARHHLFGKKVLTSEEETMLTRVSGALYEKLCITNEINKVNN